MQEQQESSLQASTPPKSRKPVSIEPDVDFIRVLSKESDNTYKRCMQCGNCSVTCGISPDRAPFPRKEMAWASWGLKDRFLGNPDIWLCYQCNDCSTQCPRGARPGDILAVIRQEVVGHYATPRFLARWVKSPKFVLLLLAIPAVLLGLALLAKDSLGEALGLSTPVGDRILFPYSAGIFPHWLLNIFFFFFGALALIAAITGVVRFWRAMKASNEEKGLPLSGKSLGSCIWTALKKVFTHEDFAACTTESSRFLPHFCVFFGFLALCVVTFWIITNHLNPLIQGSFVYPFGFWNPLKLLANLGGAAILIGCIMMIFDRLTNEDAGYSTYSDWILLGTLLVVVGTGFITELLHYARLVPHRHVAYFIHLVFVFSLIVYLPYTKFAHVIYRTAALAFAEFSGRNISIPVESRIDTVKHDSEKEIEDATGTA
jgi:quinone-modifying oxidoreductase subunit QmoC